MLTIKNQSRNKTFKEYYPILRKLFKQTCQRFLPDKDVSLSLIICESEKIHQLNRDYRGIDRPTDVLTFAALDGEQFDFGEVELGDIFINQQAVVDQAKQYGHTEKREFCFLFVHGLLHTLGYDHMTKEDEKVMFALQDEILDGVVPRNETKV